MKTDPKKDFVNHYHHHLLEDDMETNKDSSNRYHNEQKTGGIARNCIVPPTPRGKSADNQVSLAYPKRGADRIKTLAEERFSTP